MAREQFIDLLPVRVDRARSPHVLPPDVARRLENCDLSWFRGRLRRGAGHARYNVAALSYTARNCFQARARDGRALVLVGDTNGQVLATAGAAAEGPGALWTDAPDDEEPLFDEDAGWSPPWTPSAVSPRRYSLSWIFDIAASGWTPGTFVDEESIGPITYTTGAKIGLDGFFGLYTDTANPWGQAISYVEVHVVETGGHWLRLFQDQMDVDPMASNFMSAPQFTLFDPTTGGAPTHGTIDKIRATVEVVPLGGWGLYSGRFRGPGPIKLTVIPELAEV